MSKPFTKIALASTCFFFLSLPCAEPADPMIGQLTDQVKLRGVEDVHLEGNTVFLPCREGKRLTICSVEDPTQPEIISTFTHDSLEQAAGFDLHQDTVYLASQGNANLLLIDVKDTSHPRLISMVSLGNASSGTLYKVLYHEGFCYVAHQSDRNIDVVDVRDPDKPVFIHSVPVSEEKDGPFSLVIHKNHLYTGTIFGTQNRLAVLDINKSPHPVLINQVTGPDIGHLSGEIDGKYFVCVNWIRNALLIFDVSDPASPSLHSKLIDNRLGEPNRCLITRERAYLPMVKGHGVAVVDISDKSEPRFLTSYQSTLLKKTYGIAIKDHLLYVGAREGNSLIVLDRNDL